MSSEGGVRNKNLLLKVEAEEERHFQRLKMNEPYIGR